MSRPRRLSTFSYVGPAAYFLTFCTDRRRPAFLDANAAAIALFQFRKTAAQEGFAILAYCLMPDHAHMLLEALDQASDLRRLAKLAKQQSGGVYRKRFGLPLWQEGYFERILREGEDARGVARYVLNNPVRAGLVATPAEYPYLGSDRWALRDLLDSVAWYGSR